MAKFRNPYEGLSTSGLSWADALALFFSGKEVPLSQDKGEMKVYSDGSACIFMAGKPFIFYSSKTGMFSMSRSLDAWLEDQATNIAILHEVNLKFCTHEAMCDLTAGVEMSAALMALSNDNA